MPRNSLNTPSSQSDLPRLCHSKKGHAYAYFNRVMLRFGRSDDPGHKSRFDAALSEWLANGRKITEAMMPSRKASHSAAKVVPPLSSASAQAASACVDPAVITVVEVIVRYLPWLAKQYKPVSQSHVEAAKGALKLLRGTFAHLAADEFSVRHLMQLRDAMIAKGWCRIYVNRQIDRVRDLFRWATETELIPGTRSFRLASMKNLQRGHPGVREGKEVEGAPDADILACIERMPEVLDDMLRLLRWTGARPKEMMQMRWCDIRKGDGPVWWYHPENHKTKHKGKKRRICLCGEAQKVLEKYADVAPDEVILSPILAERLRSARRAATRKTPRWPSHLEVNARKKKPIAERKVAPRAAYDDGSLRQAVRRACVAAGVPVFTPYQVRHAAAAKILSQTGNMESVRAVLGHSHVNMSAHYAGIDDGMAAEAARRLQE